MRETVIFKGNREGVQLFLADVSDQEVLLGELARKLAGAARFFAAGTCLQVRLPLAWRGAAVLEERLTRLLAQHGLKWQSLDEAAPAAPQEAPGPVQEPLRLVRTLRSGQEVRHDGDVDIRGDVNPGAVVVAGGNIRIHGTCRGVVHAGFPADRGARIVADRLMASQIRIADLIARAPDEGMAPPAQTELARIEDGAVVIAPLEQEED